MARLMFRPTHAARSNASLTFTALAMRYKFYEGFGSPLELNVSITIRSGRDKPRRLSRRNKLLADETTATAIATV